MTNNQRFVAEVTILLLIGGAMFAKAGQPPKAVPVNASTVRAQRIELVDKDGKVKLVLASDASGKTGLFIPNENKPYATVFVEDGRSGLAASQFDKDGNLLMASMFSLKKESQTYIGVSRTKEVGQPP